MKRSLFTDGLPLGLLIAVAALVVSSGGCDPPAERPAAKASSPTGSRPNVLWIVWDTVRADRMSLYGHGKSTTPKLDAWAKGARVFTDCRSAAGYTIASHGSMFTGLLPSEHGADNATELLEDCHETIAELLRAAGYQTYLYSANPNVSKLRNLAQGFEVQEHPWDEARIQEATQLVLAKLDPADKSNELPGRLPGMVQRGRVAPWDLKASGVLQQKYVSAWLNSRDRSRPYFAFLNYMEAHRAYIPPRRYRERTMSPEQVAASYQVDRSWLPMWEYVFGLRDYSPEELAVIAGTYDATLLELDDLFGELISSLEAGGHLDNTVIIVTSDHGEHLGEHHLLDHQYSVHEALIRVPLVVHYPARFAPGRDDSPVMSMDLYPTLLELTGAAPPTRGHSAVSLSRPSADRLRIAQEPAVPTAGLADVLKAHPEFDARPWQRTLTAISRGSTRFLWCSDGRHELYDVAADPGESRNLVETQAGRAAKFAEGVKAIHDAMRLRCDPTGTAPPVTAREQALMNEILTGIGYVAKDEESEAAPAAPKQEQPGDRE